MATFEPETLTSTPSTTHTPYAPYTPTVERPDWSPVQRGLFRFAFVYFSGYIAYTVVGPKAASGDKPVDFYAVAVLAAVALVAAIVWSAVAKARRYDALHHGLRIAMRYTVGLAMIAYGLSKVVKSQFPDLTLEQLITPFGHASPMGLLWTFMGYSTAYNFFAGMAELTGVLLLFRRTTTLGALLVSAAMANVVMLNYTYDVPVKLFSTHLLLMSLFLALPQARRLADVFIFHRPVEPEAIVPLGTNPKWLRFRRIAKPVVIGLFTVLTSAVVVINFISRHAPKQYGPLYGVYDVEQMHRAGVDVPAGPARWHRVLFDRYSQMTVVLDNDSLRRFTARVDTVKGAVFLGAQTGNEQWTLRYSRTPDSILTLTGSAGDGPVDLRLRYRDPNSFLLVSRGFHWVSPTPFYR